jgi:hypothetical protein
MERDKILRIIDRDPDAGLKQAREWMNSPDAALVQDAITVFRDIGGHESDLRAATDRLKEESCDVNAFGPSALRGDRAEADWLTYRNAKNGLSFRYPPSTRVEERDPASFHFDYPPEAIVDVVGPGMILRFSFTESFAMTAVRRSYCSMPARHGFEMHRANDRQERKFPVVRRRSIITPVGHREGLACARLQVVTPQIVWASKETRRRLLNTAIAKLRAFLDGHPLNVVN